MSTDTLEALQQRTRQRQRAALADLKASGKSLLSQPVLRRDGAVRRSAPAASSPFPLTLAVPPLTEYPAAPARLPPEPALECHNLPVRPQPAFLRAIAGFRK